MVEHQHADGVVGHGGVQRLPQLRAQRTGQRGPHLHVSCRASRCGYCDANTYTSDGLGPGATRVEYAGAAIPELRRAAAVAALRA